MSSLLFLQFFLHIGLSMVNLQNNQKKKIDGMEWLGEGWKGNGGFN